MIIIGSDHRGFEFKQKLIKKLNKNYKIEDMGTNSSEKTDYPIFAEKVAKKVLENNDNLGILICNNGIGMSIAANKFKGVRAGLCTNSKVAKLAKSDDNINIIILPVMNNSICKSVKIINSVLNTDFKKDRYQLRLDMIDKYNV